MKLTGGGSGTSGFSTGKGLRLGQHRADVVRMYGSRFREMPREQCAGSAIQLEWRGGCTSLLITLDAEQRVTDIELSGCE